MSARKAVIVGMNYANTAYELKGCINDMCSVYKFLNESKFKYPTNNIKVLSDQIHNNNISVTDLATKTNIIASFQWLLDGAKRGDKLFFFISSHGEQVKDKNGDESDGWDEAVRCMNDELLIDDEIWTHLVSKVPPGVQLTMLFDCCHSGTITDLKYTFTFDQSNPKAPYPMSIEKSQEIKGNVISLSGCYDPHTSGDGAFEGKFVINDDGNKCFEWGDHNGAFTYFLLQTLNECKCIIEYPDLLKAIHTKLADKGYSQRPTCTCSKPQLFTGKVSL